MYQGLLKLLNVNNERKGPASRKSSGRHFSKQSREIRKLVQYVALGSEIELEGIYAKAVLFVGNI